VTTYEYDDDGRVVRAVTVAESEFSALDVAALLEAKRRGNVRRGPHGYTIAEATDPADQFNWEAHPRQDYALKALRKAQRDARAAAPDATDHDSVVWDVRKKS
jgi:hypothetical protein